jgi:hypothetical protein
MWQSELELTTNPIIGAATVITTSDNQFIDEHRRTRILRGANLGGSSKLPTTPDGATWRKDGFYDHRNVSFVGRPFPLTEADEHLRRLAAWGMTFLRFIVTWEAIEHAGPGIYDHAYLDYLRTVIIKAQDYGISVFIDPHQDVWSRFTGGDGAPGWTLDILGMDVSKLYATGAAFTHQEHGDPFPRMIWSTNYARYGAATLFTLFFAGRDFAPNVKIDGINIQDYLQSHYFNAIRQVAERLKDLPNVVGYDAMNEPSSGLIGMRNLASHPEREMVMLGAMPTPWQAIAAASGYPQTVDVFDLGLGFSNAGGTQIFNPDGVSLFRDGYACPWKREGIWADEDGAPMLLKPDHFHAVGGHPVDFICDYLKPFIRRFIVAVRDVHPGAMLFLEGIPGGVHPDWTPDDAPNAVNAAHWYDALTLFTKMYDPEMAFDFYNRQLITGADAVRQTYIDQIAHSVREADEKMDGIPTLVGEFGLPYDMFDKMAYATGDFSLHTQALDAYYNAMDANLVSATIWNYTADNSNARGDLWNDEDLSIFSRDQQSDPTDIYSGGRALAGVVRPYAMATAGEPLRMRFELATRTFSFEYAPDHSIAQPTEIYIPAFQYPTGIQIAVTGGRFEYDREAQRLMVYADGETSRVTVTVTQEN